MIDLSVSSPLVLWLVLGFVCLMLLMSAAVWLELNRPKRQSPQPCPFCGGPPAIHINAQRYAVSCDSDSVCGFYGPTRATQEAAFHDWDAVLLRHRPHAPVTVTKPLRFYDWPEESEVEHGEPSGVVRGTRVEVDYQYVWMTKAEEDAMTAAIMGVKAQVEQRVRAERAAKSH